jgi:hypothetical protein
MLQALEKHLIEEETGQEARDGDRLWSGRLCIGTTPPKQVKGGERRRSATQGGQRDVLSDARPHTQHRVDVTAYQR